MNTITLNFRKEIIADFFISQFSRRNKNKVQLSRLNDIGKYVFSQIKYSPVPVIQKSEADLFDVIIELPQVHGSTSHCHFPVLTKDDIWKINDYVTAIFNLKFQQYMLMGDKLNIPKKYIVIIFMKKYNLDIEKHSGLVKKDYRFCRELEDEIEKLAKLLAT